MEKDKEQFYRETLPPELFQVWKSAQENMRRILDFPEYSLGDVLEVTGLAKTQFLNWVNRDKDFVFLSSPKNPGTGRRRLYTGRDILMIRVAQKLNALKLPLSLVKLIGDGIKHRAEMMMSLAASGGRKNQVVILFVKDDEWDFFVDYQDGGPPAVVKDPGEIFIVIKVDHLIEGLFKELAEMKGRYFVSGTADDLRKTKEE